MAKKKYTAPKPSTPQEDKTSFDLDAILVMADIWYNVRFGIMEESKNFQKTPGPISKAACLAAAKKLGLDAFLGEVPLGKE
jgi:hypothetical protein